jgi:O-methyltransferase
MSAVSQRTNEIVAIDLYLDLMASCLTRLAFPERHRSIHPPQALWKRAIWTAGFVPAARLLDLAHLELMRKQPVDTLRRTWGQDWPEDAETMIGMKRMQNIRDCVTRVIQEGVPGDLIETGVWRGGAAIFMPGLS